MEFKKEGQRLAESDLNALIAHVVAHGYAALNPEMGSSKVMHRAGVIITPDGEISIPASLFDIGAGDASYMSESFVNKHIHVLSGYLSPATTRVRMGTKDTVVRMRETLTVTVAFRDSRGREYRAQLPFGVVTYLAKDVIIGLPAICEHFGVLMLEMLETSIALYGGKGNGANSHLPTRIRSQDQATPKPLLLMDAQANPTNFTRMGGELMLQRDAFGADQVPAQWRIQLGPTIFDTGALGLNLISSELVEAFDFQLDPFVSLGHEHTLQVGILGETITTHHRAHLVLSFRDQDGQQIWGDVEFVVVPQLTYDVVIGAATMFETFGVLALESLQQTVTFYTHTSSGANNLIDHLSRDLDDQHLNMWPGTGTPDTGWEAPVSVHDGHMQLVEVLDEDSTASATALETHTHVEVVNQRSSSDG
jgi:hypothetical protein